MLSTLCLIAIVWCLTSVSHKMISHDNSTPQNTVVDKSPTKSSEQDDNDSNSGNNSDILLWSVLFN